MGNSSLVFPLTSDRPECALFAKSLWSRLPSLLASRGHMSRSSPDCRVETPEQESEFDVLLTQRVGSLYESKSDIHVGISEGQGIQQGC